MSVDHLLLCYVGLDEGGKSFMGRWEGVDSALLVLVQVMLTAPRWSSLECSSPALGSIKLRYSIPVLLAEVLVLLILLLLLCVSLLQLEVMVLRGGEKQ